MIRLNVLLFLVTLSALGLATSISDAKVKAVSTDGEATVYLDHADFRGSFDVSYDAELDASP